MISPITGAIRILIPGFIVYFLMLSPGIHAQTNISGIINTYTSVTSMDLVNNQMTVSSSAGFSIGDLVLIIQMQGATISTANSSAFGDVTNYGGAGNYEIATLCNIDNRDFTFESSLLHADYNTAGNLQIIRVPKYIDATVTATLTGQAWDGTTGGVVALSVDNTLLLNAPIDMDGKGFRAGGFQNSTFSCNFTTSLSDYSYNTPNSGGQKGEGISAYTAGMEYGRGPQANGGGGGNDHNTGGAGGANGGMGGFGGINDEPGFFNCNGNFPGQRGKLPTLPASRIFMGGGGGAGHGNNNQGSSGANGGGIIIVLANNMVVGTANTLSSIGQSVAQSLSDGAGGGGAGGSVQLEVNTFTGIPFLDVHGGDGGNADNENLNRCFGPGGGGSGGTVRGNPTSLSTVFSDLAGGSPGVVLRSPCSGSQNATAGSAGTIAISAVPISTLPDPACGLLSVKWMGIEVAEAMGDHLVTWGTAREFNNAYFTVEKSVDGHTFQSLANVTTKGNSTEPTYYTWIDVEPTPGISFYRISQTSLDGNISYSHVVEIHQKVTEGFALSPNPVQKGQAFQINLATSQSEAVTINLFELTGKRVFQMRYTLAAGTNLIDIPTHDLHSGTYLVQVSNGRMYHHGKVLVTR